MRTKDRGCQWPSPRRGFTVIGILVVIVVIAVLAGILASNVLRHVGEAKTVSTHSQIEVLGAALDAYRLDNGRYLTAAQGLATLGRLTTRYPRARVRSAQDRKTGSYCAPPHQPGGGMPAFLVEIDGERFALAGTADWSVLTCALAPHRGNRASPT
ncbi:MAG: type II secretion system protein GspG [Longimicrobiales bacterium]